jgi:hypothetical protein
MSEACSFHDQHDAEGEPIGEPCGAPATHIIFWPYWNQYSLACERHTTTIDDDAPFHIVETLP